jgi:hypothetical protein
MPEVLTAPRVLTPDQTVNVNAPYVVMNDELNPQAQPTPQDHVPQDQQAQTPQDNPEKTQRTG